MPKWFPNGMGNLSKWTVGAPRVDLFIDFMDLGRTEKSLFFRWRTGASKNRKHRAVEPQRVAKQFDQRTGVSLSGRRVPTQQENNTALTAIQPIKDPDMLKGRRPGEFEALLFFRHLFHSES